jgi:benzoyl-CoA reductase/2-hydroxyglutaryl-CoA dehydratase subunit BcrC/BadD/HgdB
MKLIEKLSLHLKDRLTELSKSKEDGQKVIGYMPGGYMPEEIALACNAIPIGWIHGGDYRMVERAEPYLCHWMDTFCRAKIGSAVSGKDEYFNIMDVLVVPITDNHVRAVMDVLAFNTDIDIFPYGVPHTKDTLSFAYFLDGLIRLKSRLEELTGVELTDSCLREAIFLCNRERDLLRKISLMRKTGRVPLNSKDFVFLNHASFLAEKDLMLEVLESVHKELKVREEPFRKEPRILLTGSTLALGDNKIHKIVEEAGGKIVLEEFAEGMKPYWTNVDIEGNPMGSLAECYFSQRVAPAWFRPGKERLDFLVKLASEFDVSGVIWYHLMFRESYKIESYYFPDILMRKTGLPTLVVESDYNPNELGPLRTRIEAFIETIRE